MQPRIGIFLAIAALSLFTAADLAAARQENCIQDKSRACEVPGSETLSGRDLALYKVGRESRILSSWQAERERRCLALAGLTEARGDSPNGVKAVMWIVANRANTSGFPSMPCEVIVQAGAFEGVLKQASQVRLIRNGKMPTLKAPKDAVARRQFELINELAEDMLNGEFDHDPTHGATYFFSPGGQKALGRGHPDWSRKFIRTASIDGNVFYRNNLR